MTNIHTPPALQPCALPHSAPTAWLRAGEEAEAAADALLDPDEPAPTPRELRLDAIRHHMAALEELAAQAGDDGRPGRPTAWTPFCRRLFLSTLADTGRVNLACDYAALSKQSAYALRARDPIFAAGWDAAAELARETLADDVFERALDGTTETIRRDGKIIAERHRFDSKLAMAVLARLDRRCDRSDAARTGHGRAKAQWQDFLEVVGNGDDAAALDILCPPPPPPQNAYLGQSSQETPGDADAEEEVRVWWDGDCGEWRTDFPHPLGEDHAEWDDSGCRACTAEETLLLEQASSDAPEDRMDEEERAEHEQRVNWFAELRAEVDQLHRAEQRLEAGEDEQEPEQEPGEDESEAQSDPAAEEEAEAPPQ